MNLSATSAESTIERPLTPKARALLHEWVASESLRKHCEAVSACLRYVARRDGEDEDLWGAVEDGKLSLPIDKTFPLDKVVDALAMMKANQHFGKIVVVM